MLKLNIVLLFLILISSPVFSQALSEEAQAKFTQAENAFRNRELDKAESLVVEALNYEPDNAYFRYILGQIQFMQGNFIDARESFEIVQRSRPCPDRGEQYNERLNTAKSRIRSMQERFNEVGQERFRVYEQNKDTGQALRLAVTIFQAFRLNPPLRYRNFNLLENVVKTYESALKSSFEGTNWQNDPMLQLAFLYEIANQRDKAAEVYMRALDYVEDANQEFIITHRFDYLNRSNKEKLLDTIEAGEFTRDDLEDLIGSSDRQITEAEQKQFEELLDDASARLRKATSDFEREQVLESIKDDILAKQRRGELPGQEELERKLAEEGKTLEEYWAEQGL